MSTNSIEVAADMLAYPLAVAGRIGAVVRANTLLLETMIKGNASGRPGPNAPTGDYRGSWTSEFASTGSGGALTQRGEVGTNKPQARRLEHGFVGADVLGRVYNQPPFPHVQPAVERIGGLFAADMARAVQQ